MQGPEGENIPKKHHYVNRSYLKAFRNTDGLLEVFDLKKKKYFSTGPKGVAFEKWLYLLPGASDELGIEKWLGGIEDVAKRVIDEIVATKVPYSGDNYDTFMTYIATMAARTPIFLRQMEAGDKELLAMATDKERAKHLLELGSKKFLNSLDQSADASEEEILDFLKKGWDDETARQKRYITHFYWVLSNIFGPIAQRKWTILETGDPSTEFVSSDNPLGIIAKGVSGDREDWLKGFKKPETQVTLPLSPRLMLIGSFSKSAPDSATADSDMVATYNWGTIQHSTQIYSSKKKFRWNFPAKDIYLTEVEIFENSEQILAGRGLT